MAQGPLDVVYYLLSSARRPPRIDEEYAEAFWRRVLSWTKWEPERQIAERLALHSALGALVASPEVSSLSGWDVRDVQKLAEELRLRIGLELPLGSKEAISQKRLLVALLFPLSRRRTIEWPRPVDPLLVEQQWCSLREQPLWAQSAMVLTGAALDALDQPGLALDQVLATQFMERSDIDIFLVSLLHRASREDARLASFLPRLQAHVARCGLDRSTPQGLADLAFLTNALGNLSDRTDSWKARLVDLAVRTLPEQPLFRREGHRILANVRQCLSRSGFPLLEVFPAHLAPPLPEDAFREVILGVVEGMSA